MNPLFESPRLRLAPPDPETDAAIESAWTHDGAYLRLVDTAPARPLSPSQVKKKYEQLEKEKEKDFYFAVRLREKPVEGPEGLGRLIGFVRLFWVDWMHGAARLNLGIGAPADRGQGYGSEALELILRYAFEEMGLHRVAAEAAAYNTGALRFLERHGFRVEARRRQAVARDGQRWDQVMYGLLRSEWEALRAAAAVPAGLAAPQSNGAQGG
ncbi:MAG: GNAT family N-acetyltransferase [Anaerolineales bacterium]|nr:GNAT family N-acetyltransferase [Anaerolineales bacterium]